MSKTKFLCCTTHRGCRPLSENSFFPQTLHASSASSLAKKIMLDSHLLLNIQAYVDYERSLQCEQARNGTLQTVLYRLLCSAFPESFVEKVVVSSSCTVESVLEKIEQVGTKNIAENVLVVPVVMAEKKKKEGKKGGRGREFFFQWLFGQWFFFGAAARMLCLHFFHYG